MDETLQQKIQSVIAKTGMTYKELAKHLGVSKDNFYKWKDSSNPRNPRQYQQVMKGLDELLEKAEAETMAQDASVKYIIQPTILKQPIKHSLVSIPLSNDGDDPVPYIDENAGPGSVITIKERPALIAYRNESLVIGEVDGLIAVNGDSMEPRFKSGSWIAIKKLKYIRVINAGYYYYIIDVNSKGLLRKVVLSSESNSITLLPENANYPTMIKRWDEVLAVFSIEAVVIKYD